MLYINGSELKREYQLKFLGVILDENMTWKKHIVLIENKISKNIGIMYKVKLLLNQNCLKHKYFSFIHSYINYSNLVLGQYKTDQNLINSIKNRNMRLE